MCGVYYLWDGERVLYIGSSRNVAQRIRQHIHIPAIGWFYDPHPPEELRAREAEAIRAFKPLLNCVLPFDA